LRLSSSRSGSSPVRLTGTWTRCRLSTAESIVEEVRPNPTDVATWRPRVKQAVGALQADLGDLRLHIERLVAALSSLTPTAPLPASPTDHLRLDLVSVGMSEDARHGPQRPPY
jgi:hypothetical protein